MKRNTFHYSCLHATRNISHTKLMFAKNKLFLVFFAFVFSQYAYAKELLFLTETNKNGDCISSGILTKVNVFQEKLDKQYCKISNTGNKTKISQCIENSNLRESIRSFISYCGDGQTYIGINGKTYLLRQVSKPLANEPSLVGTYLSDGIKVDVKYVSLIKKTYQDETSTSDDNILDFQYKVMLIITKGNNFVKVTGIANEGI